MIEPFTSSRKTLDSSFTRSITMRSFNRFATFFFVIVFASLLGCASTSKQEGTGEYVDDTVLTAKVKAEIFNEPSLKSAEINVETFKGVVQLSGFVNSREDINKAAQVARGVKGVVSVKNDMRLK
jgi:osmotically-inducible protein OsmY